MDYYIFTWDKVCKTLSVDLTHEGKNRFACITSESDALQLSIDKYKQLLNQVKLHSDIRGVAVGADSCGLCIYFSDPGEWANCNICPVMVYSGSIGCCDTPYMDVVEEEDQKLILAAIRREIKFLNKVFTKMTKEKKNETAY